MRPEHAVSVLDAYAYGDEFEYGLALVLDGLEAAFAAEVRGRS